MHDVSYCLSLLKSYGGGRGVIIPDDRDMSAFSLWLISQRVMHLYKNYRGGGGQLLQRYGNDHFFESTRCLYQPRRYTLVFLGAF